MSYVKADLESMAHELERIWDFVFNKQGAAEPPQMPAASPKHQTKYLRKKTAKLLVVADEIYSDSNVDQSDLEEEYSGDYEDNNRMKWPDHGPSSLLED